ncbi:MULTISPECIES: hypothetical protein [Streptomyces]|uniref:hypothetical protein n=1 Tax=Streptomyces TaxID=1883 RepID=UPI000F5551D2|nr:hypothetical protein [Streptomyces sp. ADI97-07]RPK82568.1 hypothetical protein EES45_08765 [Streptomyces sp. ADI97-07]WRY84693.1 hypothetical protein OG388_27395 [Streptomyces clavifer]
MSQGNRIPGTQPTRRGGRWERYRVAHPFSAQDQAGLWGAIVGVVALALLLGWALDMKGGAVIVLATPFIISWFEKRRTAFQFDAAGARFGQVLLPWTDVTQFVVATPPNAPHALIGARLRPGAILPAGATGPSPDPAMPAPIHVAVPRSKFDLAKMVRKAGKYAPPHIEIVVADPSGERAAAQRDR